MSPCSSPSHSISHSFPRPLPSQAQYISEHSGFPHGITNSCLLFNSGSQKHLGCLNSTFASLLFTAPHAHPLLRFQINSLLKWGFPKQRIVFIYQCLFLSIMRIHIHISRIISVKNEDVFIPLFPISGSFTQALVKSLLWAKHCAGPWKSSLKWPMSSLGLLNRN